MRRALGELALPLLARLPPEQAHKAALLGLQWIPEWQKSPNDPRLAVKVLGLDFPNPLGLAAGFDKDAVAPAQLLSLGFGFVEVGTVTPYPQVGNPSPRLFRLAADGALINRMGFNNEGFSRAHDRLVKAAGPGIVGVNLGPNRDAEDRVADYVRGVAQFADVADYLTINVSSPNTAGLRDLQERAALDDLVARVIEAREGVQPRRPVLIKISPDLDLLRLDDIVSIAVTRGVDGLIVANTTVARPAGLRSNKGDEKGGLSGRPLFSASTRLLARAYLRSDGALPLIGVGGVEDFATALAKIEAGANLVQVYTGFVFRGPALIREVLNGLVSEIERQNIDGVAALVGVKASDYSQDAGW